MLTDQWRRFFGSTLCSLVKTKMVCRVSNKYVADIADILSVMLQKPLVIWGRYRFMAITEIFSDIFRDTT